MKYFVALHMSLVLLCKTTGIVAFVAPASKVPARYHWHHHVSLAPSSPLRMQVTEDSSSNSTDALSAPATYVSEDADVEAIQEKEIDWDGLGSAVFTFGWALAKGVEATVEAATPLVADAATAAADTATDMAKSVKLPDAVKVDLPKVQLPDIKVDLPKVPKFKFYDASIPYEAAIEQAYDEWKVKYNKVNPSPDDPLTTQQRYELFKTSYVRTTVANVMAKKKVRDLTGSWDEARTLNQVELDQYADLTDQEYYEATRTPSWGELFNDLADVTASVVFKNNDKDVAAGTASNSQKKKKNPTQVNKITASAIGNNSPFQLNLGLKTPTKRKSARDISKKSVAAASRTPKVNKPLFFGALSANSTPVNPKDAAFAKKIEQSRAIKAKKLAERKKKEEQRQRKARANFRP